jgi:peptide chain release factor 2
LRADFDIPALSGELADLKKLSGSPSFWDNPQEASRVQQRVALLEEEVGLWRGMREEINELAELSRLAENDQAMQQEIEARFNALAAQYDKQEYRVFLGGPYDKNGAYLSIYSGAGGADAADWAGMLLRMYQRYAERKGWKVSLEDVSYIEQGGIKEATLFFDAPYAFGFLKGEAGVHRLVRLSPFSSADLRHTSFALVDITPHIDKSINLDIAEDDLRVDLFRASGPGGQNVNKRESAVRVTHIPTGIAAASQSERNQAVNKERAMSLLRSKLYIVKLREQKETLAELKGVVLSAEWGNQIRSYVLHPYQMVKDHRTDSETSNTEAVLDGDLDIFIDAYLRQSP